MGEMSYQMLGMGKKGNINFYQISRLATYDKLLLFENRLCIPQGKVYLFHRCCWLCDYCSTLIQSCISSWYGLVFFKFSQPILVTTCVITFLRVVIHTTLIGYFEIILLFFIQALFCNHPAAFKSFR